MLVLSRQRDETICIGHDITITIVDIRGDKVRIGIEAPKEIEVHRKEVYDAILRETKERLTGTVRLMHNGEINPHSPIVITNKRLNGDNDANRGDR